MHEPREIGSFIDPDENEEMVLFATTYSHDGTTAVVARARHTGEPYGTLSTRLGLDLPDGEFVVKTYAENEAWADLAWASGAFEDTGKRADTGRGEPLPVWRLAA